MAHGLHISIRNFKLLTMLKSTITKLRMQIVLLLLFVLSGSHVFAEMDTFQPGSYIINMGIVPQTVNNGTHPYGLIQKLMKLRVPVSWIINPTKTKEGVDFTHEGIAYKGSAFIIPAEFRTTTVNGLITSFAVSGNTTTTTLIIDVAYKLTSRTYWTVMNQDKPIEIAENIFQAANLDYADSVFNTTKLANQLNNCDDIFVAPHSDPDWNGHGKGLYTWIRDSMGSMWAGCHSVSMLESLNDGATKQLNLLSKNVGAALGNALLCYDGSSCGSNVSSTAHQKASNEFKTYYYPGDQVQQYIGLSHAAQTGGSETVYVPVTGGGWRPGMKLLVEDTAQDNVYGGKAPISPGPALIAGYGRAYDNPNMGWVMYQANHDISGTSAANVAAMRQFWNFSLMAMQDKVPIIDSVSVPKVMVSGVLVTLNVYERVKVPGGTAGYTWTSSCGGTFSDPKIKNPSFTPPIVDSTRQCIITCEVNDRCNRRFFKNVITTVRTRVNNTITKTVFPTQAKVGDTVTFTLTAKNLGPSTKAVNVAVVDSLPSGYTYVSATAPTGSSWVRATSTWTIDTLKLGAPDFKLTIKAKVNSKGDYRNVAKMPCIVIDSTCDSAWAKTKVIKPITESGTVTSESGGVALADISSNDSIYGKPAKIGVGGNATIALKSGTSWPTGFSFNPMTGAVSVAPGTIPQVYPFTYTLCDVSTGPLDTIMCLDMVDFVTVTPSILPITENGRVPFVSGGTAMVNIASNDRVNGFQATLGAGGNSTVAIEGTWPTGISLDASGRVSVLPRKTPGKYPVQYRLTDKLTAPSGPNSATMWDTVFVDAPTILTPSKSVSPTKTTVGSNVVFTVTMKNEGVTTATGVTGAGIFETLPAGFALVSHTETAGTWNGSFWDIGTMAPGTTATMTITAKVLANGPYLNIIVEKCIPTDTACTSDSCGPKVVYPVTESGTVSALHGGVAIANITLNDLVHGKAAIIAAGGNATIAKVGIWPAGFTLDVNTGKVTVAPNTTHGKYAIRYSLCDKGQYFSKCTDVPPSGIYCVEVTDTVYVIEPPRLHPSKSVFPVKTTVGSNVVFTITQENVSSTAATGVGIFETLPAGFSLVSHTATIGTWDGSFWDIGNLAGGATATLSITAKVLEKGPYMNVIVEKCILDDTCNVDSCGPKVVDPVIESGTVGTVKGGVAMANISLNDWIHGKAAILGAGGNATVSIVGTWPAGITLDVNTGQVTVAPKTIPGRYAVKYSLCDRGQYFSKCTDDPTPSGIYCVEAIDSVIVTPDLVPVTNSGVVFKKPGGIAIVNIASNDTTNGETSTVGISGNSTVTKIDKPGISVWPDGIILNPLTGEVRVVPGTPVGNYELYYLLSDKNVPPNSKEMVITVIVIDPKPDTVRIQLKNYDTTYTVCTTNDDLFVFKKFDYSNCTEPEGFLMTGPDSKGCNTYRANKAKYSQSSIVTCQVLCATEVGVCDTTFVILTPPGDCDLPNFISPNGDGVNDDYVLPACLCPNNVCPKLIVYSRFGSIVYRSVGPYQNDWHGTYHNSNEDLPDGVYFSILEFGDNFAKTRTGFIEIFRTGGITP